jgi:orotidine-5'-phosphate decarboxylase
VNIAGEVYDRATANYITVNPYMGYDSVEPYLADCREFDKGLFVLVKTSNAGSRDIQDILTGDGKTIYAHVGELVSKWGEPLIGKSGYSAIGAVVGATHPEEAVQLRKIMPHTFFLVPGYGAQGGSGKDLKGLWDGDKYGMIVNSSRGITGAYASGKFASNEKDFALAAREAVLDMKADLEAYM